MDPLHGPVPNWFQRAAHDWVEVPVPVIAAIHGDCLGGGLQIALAADIRIATPDARLSVMEVKWGLIPDMSITRTLPRLVGIDVAKELAYTGRVISGSEAHALGLVTHLAEDPLAAAQELAAEIASRSPDAVRGPKRLFDESWTGSTAGDADARGRHPARPARYAEPARRRDRRAWPSSRPSSSTRPEVSSSCEADGGAPAAVCGAAAVRAYPNCCRPLHLRFSSP